MKKFSGSDKFFAILQNILSNVLAVSSWLTNLPYL